jgi:hypothetical protein
METLDGVIAELRGEIDRSTLQVIAVPDPTARYLLPQDIITEVLKYVLSEFLIGLLGLEAVGERLHAAGQLVRDWMVTRKPPAASEQAQFDAALEAAFKAARAHAHTEAQLRAASARVEKLLKASGAGPAETQDVLDSLNRVLAKSWTK